MYDSELVITDLRNILWAMDQIEKRFASVSSPTDFTSGDPGLEKLDSICLQLINIGEVLKHIDKLTESSLLANYPGVDWKKAKGMRDVITHHYFDIDAETIYTVCREHLPPMKKVVEAILKDVENSGR
jgi:uncharacterized protein with HEPN domain